MTFLRYSSSLRVETIERTLVVARRIARDVGITRVTDTTRLDRIGVPVFASIRPAATRGSLCVSAGKGLRPEEAEIGAYMEGIELAFAELERAHVKLFSATPRDVLDGATRPRAILDLCPWSGRVIDPAAPIDCVEAVDIATGEPVVVPAELVVYPLVKPPLGGRLYFGSDGNGICSGNSVDEATLHGITEVIERDATSFLNAKDTSILVYSTPLEKTLERTTSPAGAPLRDTLPGPISDLAIRLDAAGFDLWIRYLPNEFDMPAFMAVVHERDVLEGIHFGYGCHVSSSIALVRAVTEAMQCRLSAIHGGRDDLYRVLEPRTRLPRHEKLDYLERNVASASSESRGVMSFDEVPDYAEQVPDIAAGLELLRGKLAARGLHRVLRVELTPPDLPVKVVRVLVPGMEVYAHGILRMGTRMRRYLKEVAGGRGPETSSGERAR